MHALWYGQLARSYLLCMDRCRVKNSDTKANETGWKALPLTYGLLLLIKKPTTELFMLVVSRYFIYVFVHHVMFVTTESHLNSLQRHSPQGFLGTSRYSNNYILLDLSITFSVRLCLHLVLFCWAIAHRFMDQK